MTAAPTQPIRVVVLEGEGGVFSAGFDLEALDDAERARGVDPITPAADAIASCAVPVIAAIDGHCHGGAVELCAACHNPNATDILRRVAGSDCETVTGSLDDQSVDFKYMIHAIHAGEIAGYKVCGFGNRGFDFSDVAYPGNVSNCQGCHLDGTYYPPDPLTAIATTIDAAPLSAPDRSTPAGDIAITPATFPVLSFSPALLSSAAPPCRWCFISFPSPFRPPLRPTGKRSSGRSRKRR